MPKTKLNLDKRAFSIAAPSACKELPITLKTFETIAIFDIFIPNCILVDPRSDNDFCATLFTIMLNAPVLLRL